MDLRRTFFAMLSLFMKKKKKCGNDRVGLVEILHYRELGKLENKIEDPNCQIRAKPCFLTAQDAIV